MSKLNLYITLIIIFSTFSNSRGQQDVLETKVSISKENSSLKTILNEISAQTNFDFTYNSVTVDDNQLISIDLKNKSLENVLNEICRKAGLEYVLVDRQIILKASDSNDSTEYYTVSGYIRDSESGETLPGATVIVDGTETGTISNNYGFYSLTLPAGANKLIYSFVGFSDQEELIMLTEDLKLNLDLVFNAEILGEVTIETNEKLHYIEKSQMSSVKVNPTTLNTMPEFAGEVGLIKSLQSLPGIKTHSDGSAFFFVRGGNKDQNLILIDEAPVYNPAHLFGYYSVIIPDVAKDITIYKGDIPVDKGDRLSSVVSVQTKDGNLKKHELNGVLNPLMYRFSVEGPVVKNKSSFYTSFRHSNFRWLYRREAPENKLYLYDLNAKINWQMNQNNRIYFSFFYGTDNFYNNNENSGINWYNFTSTLRWNHVFNNKLFSNATVYLSRYNYSLLIQNTEWNSGIGNVSFAYDLSWYPQPEYEFKFGFNQTGHDFNPGNLINSENNPFVPRIEKSQADKTVIYASGEHKLSKKFSYKIGLRMPVWNNKGPTTIYQFDTAYQVIDTLVYNGKTSFETFANLDPRLSITYKPGKSSSLKFSYGIYHQYMHLLSNSISPFSSFEIWMPSNSNIKPQKATQLALGFYKYFNKSDLEITTEAYYKIMDNQIDYESHANLMLNPLIEGELRFGKAKAYGIEFLLRKTKGRLTGWLGYTYSRILKKIDDVNGGREFPAYYDRPHDISIFVSYNISKRVNLTANWVYYTGSAITTPIAYYSYNNYVVPVYGEKNNTRLPDYHRLDLALLWRINKFDNKFQHSLTFALYNFYNRHNPVSISFNKIEKPEGSFVVRENLYGTSEILTTQKYLLGIMPSVTYKFRL